MEVLIMDILWVKDAPFWQKMFFVGILAGVTFAINFLLEVIIPEAKNDYKNWTKARKSRKL